MSKKPKVGLCFLVYHGVKHPAVWERFFREGTDDDYEIIAHIKKPTKDTQSWLKARRVRSARTGHCEFGLVSAHLKMVRQCLALGCSHCLLISQDCVPLRTRDDLLAQVKRMTKSRFCTVDGAEYPHNDLVAPEEEIAATKLRYHASQWSILTKKVMEAYLTLETEPEGQAFRRYAYRIIHKYYTAEDAYICADERIPLSYLLQKLGRGNESVLRKYVDFPAPATYVHWFSTNEMSPTPMNVTVATKTVAKWRRSKGEWLLTRKVYPSAVHVVAFCLSKRSAFKSRPASKRRSKKLIVS